MILIKSIEFEGGNLELLKILLFIISIFIFISIEVSIQNSKNVSEKIIISSLKIFLEFLIFMIIFSCTIVYDGALWIIQKLEDYNENGQKIEFSEVYTSDGQVNEYICIENNGSNFIGFNVKKGQVENLSFNSISKIEYVNKCKKKEIKKYNEKEANGEEKQIAKLINDYYKVVKDNDKAISCIKKNSLTTYYEDKYNNINPELLDKQYNVSDEKHKMADLRLKYSC